MDLAGLLDLGFLVGVVLIAVTVALVRARGLHSQQRGGADRDRRGHGPSGDERGQRSKWLQH
jgi:hypothetical protein